MSRRTTNIDPAKFRREAAYAELIYDLQTTAGNSTDADLVKVWGSTALSSRIIKTWFVRRNRGWTPVRAVCQVNDTGRVRERGRRENRTIFS